MTQTTQGENSYINIKLKKLTWWENESQQSMSKSATITITVTILYLAHGDITEQKE